MLSLLQKKTMPSLQVQVTIAGLPFDYSSEAVLHHIRSHCCGFTIVSWLCTSDVAVIVLMFSNKETISIRFLTV